MTGPSLRASLALLSALLLAAGPGAAQEEGAQGVRVGITYRPGYVPGLVMPEAEGADGLEEASARADEILRADLDHSDRFEIIPVPDSLNRISGVGYGLWNELGAVWLVAAEVTGTPGDPSLRVSLHDVVYGELRNVQAFPLPAPDEEGFRMAVHRVSDAVVEWATGEPGIAATRVAFRRKRGGGAGSDIYVVDADGHGLRQVTHDTSIVYSPALSPDGRRVMYVSYAEHGRPAVFEKDLRTGATRPVSAEPGVNITPTYRPDGRRVLLARSAGGGTEIFELEADPLCCARRVTNTPAGDALGPAYSPDGRRFAFEASALGQPHVYVQRVEGGGPGIVSRYVYGEEGRANSPDWSPRGDRLAYQAWVEGVFQIVTVNADGSDRRVLTSRGSNEDPSWAPDGRHVVFASDRRGYRGLWILDSVTGRVRSLVTGHVDQMPDWSLRLAPSADSVGNDGPGT